MNGTLESSLSFPSQQLPQVTHRQYTWAGRMAQCDPEGKVKMQTDSESNESTTDPPTGSSKDAPLPENGFAEVRKNIAKHKAASPRKTPSLPHAMMHPDFIKPETFQDTEEAAKREKELKNEFSRFLEEQERFGKGLSDEQFDKLADEMGNFERNDFFDDDDDAYDEP